MQTRFARPAPVTQTSLGDQIAGRNRAPSPQSGIPKRQRGPRAPRERGQAAMPVASVLSPTGMPG
jgi:hypothetical protein